MKKPAVILIAPQMGENIGSAARVMLNFGVKDLRIVNPRDGWPNPKAVDMAKGAKQIIHDAQIFTSLADACHDIKHLYATTARPRDMVKTVITPRKCAEKIVHNSKTEAKSAIMFGPERTGLHNDDITLSDAIVAIPVSEEYASLNLAQAVSVLCYEYFSIIDDSPAEKIDFGRSAAATKKELDNLFEHLEQELDSSGFFKVDHKKEKMSQNIRNMFLRSDLTDQDVRTLRGIIKSLTNK